MAVIKQDKIVSPKSCAIEPNYTLRGMLRQTIDFLKLEGLAKN